MKPSRSSARSAGSLRTARLGVSPVTTSARRARPARTMDRARSIPLTKLLQALVTSRAWAREPSSACTMCAVAGSTRSREAEAKTSRSTSSGPSPAASSARRAAPTARVEAYTPSPATRRETIPVACVSILGGSARPLRCATSRRRSSEESTSSGNTLPTAVIPARGGGSVG